MPIPFRLAVALLCATLATTGYAAGSLAQPGRDERAVTSERERRPPSELWEKFPLEEPPRQRLSPRSGRSSSQLPEPAALESDDSGSDQGELMLLLAGLAALVLLGPAALVLVRLGRAARAGVPDGSAFVSWQRERLLAAMGRRGTSLERADAVRAVAIHALECDMVVARNAKGRNEPVEEKIVVRPAVEGDQGVETPVEDEAVQEKPTSRDYAQFGDRVAAVLQAAEEAAEQIRADAKASAEQMTRQAEQEANTRLEESRKEAERVRTEAHTESKNTREAVELYATNHRREAEERAGKLLSDAETQARASREAAEAMAQRIEESARSLEDEAREQERMIRGRMQRYLAALRDVSRQMEDVLGEPAGGGETLVEALDVERAKEG
jgi:hypothetical protein